MNRKGWEIFERANRRMGLRIIAAYRIVAKEALDVLAGMLPPELLAEYT